MAINHQVSGSKHLFYKRAIFFLVLLTICVPAKVYCQYLGDNYKDIMPSAVFVQLSAQRNRINALKKSKQEKRLVRFEKDVKGVMEATIIDFIDHFNACPLYFYIDTNFSKVMKREFQGVLLNPDLSPARNINIKDSSYMIVCYGYPSWQTVKRESWDTTKAVMWGGKPNGKGLIMNDYKFRQIGYMVWAGWGPNVTFSKKSPYRKYRYVSKKFDVDYFPFARRLNFRIQGVEHMKEHTKKLHKRRKRRKKE